jgi:hypothetical protein
LRPPVILRIFRGTQLVEVKQFDLEQIVIGHNAEVQIDLDDSSIAPIHSLIELRDSGYYICDLGSSTGTLKNGVSILDESISSGDEIGVGPFTLAFFVGVPKPISAPPSTKTMVGIKPQKPVTPVNEESVLKKSEKPQEHHYKQNLRVVSEPVIEVEEEPQEAYEEIPAEVYADDVDAEHEEVESEVIAYVDVPSHKHHKGHKTFAPPSEIKDIRDFYRPQIGPIVEVIVAWKERVIDISHFRGSGPIKVGGDTLRKVNIPGSVLPDGASLADVQMGMMRVLVPPGAKFELIDLEGSLSIEELKEMNKVVPHGNGYIVTVDQEEMGILSFLDGQIQVLVRAIPDAPIPVPGPWIDFTAAEISGMFLAVIVVVLLSLYVSIYAPIKVDAMEKQEEVKTIAKFVYSKPPAPPPPPPPTEVKPPPPPPPPPPKPKEVVMDKKEAPKQASLTKKELPKKPAAAEKASLKPAASNMKQGGAKATGAEMGANAKSAPRKDVTKTGLLSAFGGGGMRDEIDTAYSGSGDALGFANNAKGKSGINENRAGKDLGQQFKETGPGGRDTETQGIANVGTKGRSSGQSEYGTAAVGEKSGTSVAVGGKEEEFMGSIDREAVRRVVKAGSREIRGCYERQLIQNPNLEGKVVISWDIGEAGKVLKASVKSTTLNNPIVENCIVERLKSWRFPEPPAGLVATVQYPFMLMNQK